MEKSLSQQYQQRLTAHAEVVDRWRADVFPRLDSPTEEAKFDLDRFLAKYFLEKLHGEPFPDKTKEPLILREGLKSKFESAVQAIPGLAAHITDRITVVGWETNLSHGLDKAFAELSSPDAQSHVPTTEANFDLDRFLAKYLLDGLNGEPAPQKTPDPIILYPFFKHESHLREAVALIPGLHIRRADGLYGARTIVGWNASKVELLTHKIEEEKTNRLAEKAAAIRAWQEKEWQRALRPHHGYMKNRQNPSGPLTLDQLAGSYVVRCEGMDGEVDDGDVMTLDIVQPCNSHGGTAAFDIKVIQGTMLLALSDDALHRLKQDLEVDSEDEVDMDSSSPGPQKRKAQGTHPTPAPIKRRLGESPKPNRVYLQWAGRGAGMGEIQVHTANEHTGYLDFDETRASARGVLASPDHFRGGEVAFIIHKVADRPSKLPDPWSHFSQKQYDYESTARWSGW